MEANLNLDRILSQFTGRPHNRGRGAVAEDAAVRYLTSEGYRIVARNVVTKAGELDVLAWDGDVLCFVEVKARASGRLGSAIEAVDRRKQQRIARAASLVLAKLPAIPRCRFDVLGLDRGVDGHWRPTLVRDAFEA